MKAAETDPLSHHPLNILMSKWTFGLLLALMLGCALFLRFSDLSAPLLDFHPTRQLFGAIKARGIYFENLPDAPAFQKELAVRQFEGEATIEPPLMENLAAFLYSFFGEQTAIPRAISASFWMLGGIFLFLLAKNLSGSSPAAAAGLAFYLLLPYAVTASRAFQPDPLMVLLLLIFWWGIENWGRHVSWQWALIAGISGGMAVFVKFPAVFFVIVPALLVVLGKVGLGKAIRNVQSWAILLLGLFPPAAYLYYGTVMHGFLGQQFGDRFYPEMWTSPFFYLRWFLKVQNIASVLWIALALLGWLVYSSRSTRLFLGSLWAAYILFGLIFAHHISSHDYYSLPLVPILALSLAQFSPAVSNLFRNIPDPINKPEAIEGHPEKRPPSSSQQLILITLLCGSMLLSTVDQYIKQRTNDYRPLTTFWAEVGNAIGHQPGVLALTGDYGYSLAYYGWQNSSPWPSSQDIQGFSETFTRLAGNKAYFLVTDFDEYARQPDLQNELEKHYPVLSEGRGYVVFDLYHRKK